MATRRADARGGRRAGSAGRRAAGPGSGWQLDRYDRAAARAVGDREAPAERLDAIRQPAQSGPGRGGSAAAPVAGDLDPQAARHALEPDLDARRVRVLDRVRDALGDDEVRARLDGLREALVRRADDPDRQRRAVGERPKRRRQPALGEDRRVQPAGELAQLLHRQGELVPRAGDELLRSVGAAVELGLQHAQLDRKRDEALLRAVVEVALETAALVQSGLED